MKKQTVLAILVLSLVFAAGLGAESFMVKSVQGMVKYEAAPGVWKTVDKGITLPGSAVVNTGFNSVLILTSGEKTHRLGAMQKGSVEQLCSGISGSTGSIRLVSRAGKSRVTAEALKARSSISTASTRASEVVGDLEWEE